MTFSDSEFGFSKRSYIKDVPYVLIPDYSLPLLILMVALSRLVDRAAGPTVVTRYHLLAVFLSILFIFCYFLTWIF